jgi:hypothetical protein
MARRCPLCNGLEPTSAQGGCRQPTPRLLQRAETGAAAVVRAFGPGQVRWNLDASAFQVLPYDYLDGEHEIS